MPIVTYTQMIRNRPSARDWPTTALLALLAALTGMASMAAQATGPRGEIPDRIFAHGFEEPQPPGEVERLPAADSVLPADALPEIGLRLLEGELDPSGWRLFVDDEDVTSQAQVSTSGIVYTPDEPLFEGDHAIQVRHGLRVWNWGFWTTTPPDIHDLEPSTPDGVLPIDVRRPRISASFSDVGSGIDVESVRIVLNGEDVTTQAQVSADGLTYQPVDDLPDGGNAAYIYVQDLAGNSTYAPILFVLGEAPSIEFLGLDEMFLPFGSVPEIFAQFSLSRGEIDPESIRFWFNDEDLTHSTHIEWASPRAGTLRFDPGDQLPSGWHNASLEMASVAGLVGSASSGFEIDESRTYRLELLSPLDGSIVLEPNVEVKVLADWTIADSGPAPAVDVWIAGSNRAWVEQTAEGFEFVDTVPLERGPNLIVVKAVFQDGIERELSFTVFYEASPDITITSPADWSSFGPVDAPGGRAIPGGARDLTGAVQRPVAITGTTTMPVVSVQINQQQAQLGSDGRSFTFPTYFLHEGANHISAVATDAHGRSASDQITVYVDQTAPLLTVESPTADTVTSLRRIDVRGLVNDAVQAPVETAAPRVRVRNAANGAEIEAVVGGLGYVAQDVPLEVGLNRLEVTALDQHGNGRSRSVELVRTLAGSGRLVALSGNRQEGPAGTPLPQPLVVQAFDADGEPMANVPVHVDIVRGSGSIHAQAAPNVVDGINPPRNLVLATDDEGLIEVWLELGVDARPGSDVVRVWSPGFAEEAMFSATAEAGVPSSVHVYGSSGTQYVATDSTPIEALMVQVQDARHNPVPGTLVEFRIESGDARFSERSAPAGVVGEDGRTITVQADRTGIAVVRPQSGQTPGTVRVQAQALTDSGDRIGPVGFHLVVRERQDGPTRLAGTVLDHTGTPLAGVRLSIGRTALSVLSDASGYFEFAGQVPPGKVDLFVDGRDVRFHRGGSPHEYPALHFEASVIQGQLNQLPHPIYLPPIDLGQTQIVGGEEEAILTLPGFEGFEMRVQPNSVTFPDGSRVGPLAIAPVHNDRLPMVPLAAAGRFETVGWTIQPTNTRFDPPIQVRIPNTSGLRPGQTIPIQQWDHDLALFVPMGNGTVSEDGAVLVSDPGSGITKAGWGGGPPPPPPNTGCGSAPACTLCEELVAGPNGCPVCRPRQRSILDEGLSVRGDSCGMCILPPDPYPTVQLRANNQTENLFFAFNETGHPDTEGARVHLSARISGDCPSPSGRWIVDGGTELPGLNTVHRFTTAGANTAQFIPECNWGCPQDLSSETLSVEVVRVELGHPPSPWQLMQQRTMTIAPTPTSGAALSRHRYLMRRVGGGTHLVPLDGMQGPSSEWTARVAGHFEIKGQVWLDGAERNWIFTEPQTVEIQFPLWSDILAAPGVRARMDQAWASTVAATTPTHRREEGYYITLDTGSGNFGTVAHSVGTAVTNNQVVSWDTAEVPRPPDSRNNPGVNSNATYVVAWFHTHTPMTYRVGLLPRPVGPSGPDHAAAVNSLIRSPGFAYDYLELPVGSGSIGPGHALNSPAMPYQIIPPERRDTPRAQS